MSKLSRDAAAFAQRVKMGSATIWLLVEGTNQDQPFYDRVLEASGSLDGRDYSIRLVQQLELDGKSAGGKKFSTSLFEYFEAEGTLKQYTRGGMRYIAFALDRDFDDFTGALNSSPHVLYTTAADVEAEILTNGDIQRSAASAYSLSKKQVARAVSPSPHVAVDLANRWREWITLRAIAVCCEVEGSVRHAHFSQVNDPVFGPADQAKVDALHAQIVGKLDPSHAEEQIRDAKRAVDEVFDRGDEWKLVKGKWLSKFIWHLLDTGLRGDPREANVPASVLVKTCLETLDFSAAWAAPMEAQVEALLSS